MRVKTKVSAQIGRDINFNQKLFYVEESDSTVVADNFTEQASGTFQLDPDASRNISLQDIQDARGLYLEADQEVTVTLNGTAVLQLRRPTIASTSKCRLFFEGTVTSLNIQAPSSAKARGCFCLWGDIAID